MTGTAIGPSRSIADELESSALESPGAEREALTRWLRRPVVACLLLLAIYAIATLALNDPRGTLGTDTGGKLATLHVMEHEGTLVPEVGYWAAASDRAGDLHPLFYTFKVNGRWVNVTTLPMIYAAYPLFLLGGDRAVLLLPMLGSILCALAARSIARRLGARSGWTAFWVMGLASPLAIYALDFWEHSIGLGLMLWGVYWLLRMLDEQRPWRSALIGGAFFGAAATMRTEALVYLVVCGGSAALVVLWRKRELVTSALVGACVLVGAAFPLLANDAFERLMLGGTIRASRAAGTAADAGGGIAVRAQDAVTTFLGVNRFQRTEDYAFGVLIVGSIGLTAWALSRRERLALLGGAAFAAAIFFYLMVFDTGTGFISGMLVASPFAAVGVLLGWRGPTRLITTMAVVALPCVWAVEYTGGAGPQWGGRYTLLSGALLLVAATVVLEGHRTALLATATIAVLITGFGLSWLSVRSNWVAHGIEEIVDRHDQAVISGEAHVLREGGAFYSADRHWLTATSGPELHRAVEIVDGTGADEFAYVVGDGASLPAHLDGFERTAVQRVQFITPDTYLKVGTYTKP